MQYFTTELQESESCDQVQRDLGQIYEDFCGAKDGRCGGGRGCRGEQTDTYIPAINQLCVFLDRLPEGRDHEGGDARGSKHNQLAL